MEIYCLRDIRGSLQKNKGSCSKPICNCDGPEPWYVSRSDEGVEEGTLTSTITLTKINNAQDGVKLSDANTNTVGYMV